MKQLLLIALLLLTGCDYLDKQHAKTMAKVEHNAKLLCSCHGGLWYTEDTGLFGESHFAAKCNNGYVFYRIEEYNIYSGCDK